MYTKTALNIVWMAVVINYSKTKRKWTNYFIWYIKVQTHIRKGQFVASVMDYYVDGPATFST